MDQRQSFSQMMLEQLDIHMQKTNKQKHVDTDLYNSNKLIQNGSQT